MPQSYALASDQSAAPFQMQAAQAEANAISQAPQLAIQAYAQMQQLRQQAQQHAAHVAMEQAKMQELQLRSQAYAGELQLRQMRAQTQVAETQAHTAMMQAKAAQAPFEAGLEYDKAYEIGQGKDTKWIKYLINSSGRPESVAATDEDIARARKMREMEERRYSSSGSAKAQQQMLVGSRFVQSMANPQWEESLSEPAQKFLNEIRKDYGDAAVTNYLFRVATELHPDSTEGGESETAHAYLELLASKPDQKLKARKAMDKLYQHYQVGGTK